ncbi:hypothetical protein [Microbacterium schleiferi]|uniref:hypothetical protein n=1 Tax=Microbacterium schleiferi TaxID=69362 RepID=UPI00311D450F|tara:strand:+ start:292 stop:588 length:297 start_codon:yes stop_codon:yes gene_type:complete
MEVIETSSALTVETLGTARANTAVWYEVDRGFWVGSAVGEFLGTIERRARDSFVARGATGSHVGQYETMDAARAAITGTKRYEVIGGRHAQDGGSPRG